MIVVILIAIRFKVNPDNIGTPIAAALGDLTNIIALSYIGTWYYQAHLRAFWINIVICVILIVTVPAFAYGAYREEATRDVLKTGWTPILLSMLISSGGGFILESAIRTFSQMALYQPVINGVGGNLVGVHASRLSTYFHKRSPALGTMPSEVTLVLRASPWRAFLSRQWDARSARVLLLLVIPGHLIFMWTTWLADMSEKPPSATFMICYLIAAASQVLLLLYVCQWLVAFLWSRSIDPDNAAIPYMTALGDLLGTGFLYVAFLVLSAFKAI